MTSSSSEHTPRRPSNSWIQLLGLFPAGIVLLTRISGLLLSAIAVQLVADSVRAFVHQG